MNEYRVRRRWGWHNEPGDDDGDGGYQWAWRIEHHNMYSFEWNYVAGYRRFADAINSAHRMARNMNMVNARVHT